MASLKQGPVQILKGLRHDLFYGLIHRQTSHLCDLGDPSDSCNWTIRTRDLTKKSVVISAGVGRDISFEHALADRFGMRIHLLDPSPTGMETMRRPENSRPEFCFYPVALSKNAGKMLISPPPNPIEGSWVSEMSRPHDDVAASSMLEVPCESLTSMAARLGIDRIHLLKMDIEGAEFAVVDSILQGPAVVDQIAVEFHNAVLPGIKRGATIRALLRLFAHGYRLIYKVGSNHTLMLRKMLS